MSVALNRTAVILLASGLSRRYGRKDKMLASLGGKPLAEHAAGVVLGLDALARVAVCPADRREVGERLSGRFVIALNNAPKSGLGHSIALGAQVALQFKPDAMLFAMADMPFVDAPLLREIMDPVDPSVLVEDLAESSDEVFAHVAAELEGREFGEVDEARSFVAGLRAWAKERGIKTRDLLHPLRLALTGKNRGPEMAHLFAVLGADEARERIVRAREARLGV